MTAAQQQQPPRLTDGRSKCRSTETRMFSQVQEMDCCKAYCTTKKERAWGEFEVEDPTTHQPFEP
eukprot:486054-Prymnesium_polylepis.1